MVKDSQRLVIVPEMIPHIIEKYDEYYNKVRDIKITDIGKELNELFTDLFLEEYDFDESAYRKTYKNIKDGIDMSLESNFSEEEIRKIAKARNKLNFESKMLQTEKIEYHKISREHAREELIIRRITDEVKKLKPINIPKKIMSNDSTEKCGILAFGDEHYGVEFDIKGIYGETINSYSPEIFEQRMWSLLKETISIVKKDKFKKLYVYSVGDFCDGVLRVSQLQKLKYGVVESTIKYSEFMCNWLNELSKHVFIEFQMVDGNHSELRMLGQPKGTFTDENMGKIVLNIIKTRLSDNKNFILVENPTGLIFSEIAGYRVLGIHGEVKNTEQAVKDFSKIYDTKIDILISGHIHHSKSENVGIDSEVITVPSIVGVDSYSMSLKKTGNAGATLIIVENNKSVTCQYHIKLN